MADTKKTVEEIINAIDEDEIYKKVKEPEKNALNSYMKKQDRLKTPSVKNFEEFRKELIGFIQHREKEITGGKLSDEAAFGDAAEVLNNIYRREGGYLGAYEKARKGEMTSILANISAALEKTEVDKYVAGVMSRVDPMDFNKHVEVATMYKERFCDLLPKKLKAARPEVLARKWDSLIHNHAAAIEQAKHTLEQYEPGYEQKKAA